MVSHAVQAKSSVGNWIVDLGATCHMCDSKELFRAPTTENEEEVTLGDSHSLKVIGQGVIELVMNLLNGRMKKFKLLDMLY